MIAATTRRSASAAIFLTLALAAGIGHAQVLDDFEAGAFSLSDATFASSIQLGLPPVHCIASERRTQLFVNGDLSGADLSLGAVDDEVTTVWGDAGGHLQFDYVIPPTDLTNGGSFDAMRVHLTVAVPAGRVEVRLEDAAGDAQLNGVLITGPGDYFLKFSEYGTVDVGNVTRIELHLDAPGVGDYHISDFRLWESGTAAGSADVSIGSTEGPPYPTPPALVFHYPRFAS